MPARYEDYREKPPTPDGILYTDDPDIADHGIVFQWKGDDWGEAELLALFERIEASSPGLIYRGP